jgi:hypothetical protein
MKRIIILGVFVAIVIVAWSVGWWFVAGQVRNVVLSLADADGQTSPRLTCSSLDVGGWPFQINLDCPDAVLVWGDTSLEFPELQAAVVVYDPKHALLYARGPLTISDAFTGSREDLAWSRLEASARLTDWRIGRISVIADDLDLTDALTGDTQIAKASHAEVHLVDLPDQHDAQNHLAAVRNYVMVKDLAIPGLGITGGQATLDDTLTGLPDDVRTYGDGDLLRRVQQAGGNVTINGLKGTDGPNFVDVTGKVSLDAEGRPQGQLAVASKGVVERLGAAIPDAMRAILLGNPGPDGSYKQTFTMSNGVLLDGIVPLTGLPSLF